MPCRGRGIVWIAKNLSNKVCLAKNSQVKKWKSERVKKLVKFWWLAFSLFYFSTFSFFYVSHNFRFPTYPRLSANLSHLRKFSRKFSERHSLPMLLGTNNHFFGRRDFMCKMRRVFAGKVVKSSNFLSSMRRAFIRFGVRRRHLWTRAGGFGSAPQARAFCRQSFAETFRFASSKLRFSRHNAGCSRSAFKKTPFGARL